MNFLVNYWRIICWKWFQLIFGVWVRLLYHQWNSLHVGLVIIIPNVGNWVQISFVALCHCTLIWLLDIVVGTPRENLWVGFGALDQFSTRANSRIRLLPEPYEWRKWRFAELRQCNTIGPACYVAREKIRRWQAQIWVEKRACSWGKLGGRDAAKHPKMERTTYGILPSMCNRNIERDELTSSYRKD